VGSFLVEPCFAGDGLGEDLFAVGFEEAVFNLELLALDFKVTEVAAPICLNGIGY
jgi:hypothetical protein